MTFTEASLVVTSVTNGCKTTPRCLLSQDTSSGCCQNTLEGDTMSDAFTMSYNNNKNKMYLYVHSSNTYWPGMIITSYVSYSF